MIIVQLLYNILNDNSTTIQYINILNILNDNSTTIQYIK